MPSSYAVWTIGRRQTLQTRLAVKGSVATVHPLYQRRGGWWLQGRSVTGVSSVSNQHAILDGSLSWHINCDAAKACYFAQSTGFSSGGWVVC